MKILHTSNWHLGLMTDGLCRMEEQKKILDEICDIADKHQIDLVLICGDILSSESDSSSDRLMADTFLRLSNNGKRVIMAIAGNHDADDRFVTTKKYGWSNNIFLLRDMGTDDISMDKLPKDSHIKLVDKGRGYLTFKKGDNEKTTIAFMPYPAVFFAKEATKLNETMEQKAQRLLELGTYGFGKDSFNILATHLFVPTPKQKDCVYFSITRQQLPKTAHYTALGHVHDKADMDGNLVYSGGIIQCYQEEDEAKYVVVLDIANNKLQKKEFVRLKTPKKIVKIIAESTKELREKLSKLDNSYIAQVQIKQENILADEIDFLRVEFPFISTFTLIPNIKKKATEFANKKISDKEIFQKYYFATTGKKPNKDLEDLFEQIMRGQE